MVGQTLTALRSRIETRAVADGPFGVVCGRTNERIVPLGDLRFPDRETAAEAAQLAEQYRAALRRYDPELPCHDPVVCELPAVTRTPTADPGRDWAFPPTPPASTPGSGRIEFCHRVAGAVFETLSAGGHDAAERAVMDAYFEAAEAVTSRDRLCLHLLEGMAATLAGRFPPATQAEILREAATQLPGSPADATPVAAAFDRLGALEFFESYSLSDADGDAVCVSLTDYALSSTDAALPTLPITVDLLRRRPEAIPAVPDAVRVDDETWELTLATAPETPVGLSTAPVAGRQ
ncbi:DUF7551 domain-containing protein [Halostella litorea]|uniref:DUF7551 domain-containing protein n=1 Tax=Halostella litorea TaxID=2528831 RepID=UPI0010925D82|nr:hypothetical protein [Halostella litorea]